MWSGNTVVCKPSEMTSVTAWMLCQVCQQVGQTSALVQAGRSTYNPGTNTKFGDMDFPYI